uniref:VWFA domain-containing protein n=1 Tax=Parastrongyloides trichosuri TaxID=131310 RepID=A0A0N4ZPM0_PARTI
MKTTSLFLFTFLLPITLSFVADNKIFNVLTEQSSVGECNEYYSLFLLDKSFNGSKNIFNQISIVDYFYEKSNLNNEVGYVTVTGQGLNKDTNDFAIVGPNDSNSLNSQINSIINDPSSTGDISFYPITYDIAASNMLNNDKTKNPTIILLINSNLNDIKDTSHILNVIKSSVNNGVTVLGVIFDEQYRSDAVTLVGSTDMVYTYNFSTDDNYNNIINWIHNNICSPSLTTTTTNSVTDTEPSTTTAINSVSVTNPSTTTMNPTTISATSAAIVTTESPSSCQGYINIIIDSSSGVLNSDNYNAEINVIKDSFKTLINDYTKVSLSSYSSSISLLSFNSIQNENDFDIFLTFFKMSPGSSLPSILNELSIMEQDIKPVTTYLFISQVDNNNFADSQLAAYILKEKGALYIITKSGGLPIIDISPLNPTNSTTWSFDDLNFDSVSAFFKDTFPCKKV